jgi:esterase/lipase
MSNARQTVKNFVYIKKVFNYDVNKINNDVVVLGTSLGGIAAFMCANDNKKVKKIILLVPGERLSVSTWEGIRTQNIRESFEKQGISLEKLKFLWKDIEPVNNIDHLQGKKIMIFNSISDSIIPYDQSKSLIKELRKRELDVKVVTNWQFGHHGTIGSVYFWKSRYRMIRKFIDQ